MTTRAATASVFFYCVSAGALAAAQATPPPGGKGAMTTKRASGTFEVKMRPLADGERLDDLTVKRFTFDKQLAGGFAGTSRGEMMATSAGGQGSGAYVAVERLTGVLEGRRGSFTVVHRGTMREGGSFDLAITVVPDSGSGQLAGLAGSMTITIAGGAHSYELEYTLPPLP
jgi:hypothetical protein